MNLYSISNSKKNSIGIYSVSITNIAASPRTLLMFSFNWLPFAAWMTARHKWMRYFTLANTMERNRRPANCQEIHVHWMFATITAAIGAINSSIICTLFFWGMCLVIWSCRTTITLKLHFFFWKKHPMLSTIILFCRSNSKG